MIKLLVSDLDDTIYDWSGFFVPAFYAMADEIAAITGIDEDALLDEYRMTHQRLGSVEYPYATLQLPSIRKKYPKLSDDELKQVFRPAFQKFNSIRNSHLHLFSGAEAALDTLYNNGITLIGYTESSQETGVYRLQKLGVEKYFKHIYAFESGFQSSYAANEKVIPVHRRKPDVELLSGICQREGYLPGEVVYVGDSLTKDVYMAKAAGVTAVWANYFREDNDYSEKLLKITSWLPEDYEREKALARHLERNDIKPDYVIHSFCELTGIVFPNKQ